MKHIARSLMTILGAALLSHGMWADDHFENASPEKFLELIEQGDGIILDVRTPDEVAQGHLPGASILNFYDDDFERKLNLMRKDIPIYVYCRSGGRSARAAEMMKKNGFADVHNLLGGIGAWNKAKLPTKKPSGAAKPSAPTLSLEQFEQSLESNRVTLVDFHTPWCAPCKQMAPIVDALEKELGDKAGILRIDLDANPHLAERYQVQGVPVFAIFVDGEERWRHSGVIEAKALRSAVDKDL